MKTSRSVVSSYTPLAGRIIRSPGIADAAIAPEEDNGPVDAHLAVPALGKIRVAIVDDDRTLREGCASVLRIEGYNVTVLGRGDEAIEMLQRTHLRLEQLLDELENGGMKPAPSLAKQVTALLR